MKNTEHISLQEDRARRIEDLVREIKCGRCNDLYALWSEIEELCNWYCRRLYWQLPDYFLLEYEDLTQCGYLALIEALQHYDLNGAGRFSFYYLFYLTAAVFRENGLSNGGHYPDGRRRFDPAIDSATVYIDAETDRDGEKAGTLHDVLESGEVLYSGMKTISDVIDGIYLEQLHTVLEDLVEALPRDERILIRKKYYAGIDRKAVSVELGISPDAAASLEDKALIDLRSMGQRIGLEQYLESKINYYQGTGLSRFRETGESSTERLALKRLDYEARYKAIEGSFKTDNQKGIET